MFHWLVSWFPKVVNINTKKKKVRAQFVGSFLIVEHQNKVHYTMNIYYVYFAV